MPLPDDLEALALCLLPAAPYHYARVADDLGALALCPQGWVSGWQEPCFLQQQAAAALLLVMAAGIAEG